MARAFPTIPREGAPDSEKCVFAALSRLDDDWIVVHSTAWQSERGGRQGDGEADFILIHPNHGIGVLEVKGGGIAVDASTGAWTARNRYGQVHRIKDPFRQATASKYMILDALKGLDPFLPHRVRLFHAVVFPDVVATRSFGTHPRGIVIDARDLTSPQAALIRVLDHWGVRNGSRLNSLDVDSIRSLLAPSLEVRRALVADVQSATAKLVDLTARQIGIFEAMQRNRRLVVLGGAGTGKSILAAHRARQLVHAGRRVLVTCFNVPLARHLRCQLADVASVEVTTFHAFCGRIARALGRSLPGSFDDSWWIDGPATTFASLHSAFSRYDDVIVDEGQDFSLSWLSALEAVATPDANVVVFADVHQQLYERGFAPPPDWPIVELELNCRNTLPIARWVARVAGDPDPTVGAEGRAPVIVSVPELQQLVPTSQTLLDRILSEEGLEPQQVVVLTDSRHVADKLRLRTIGEWSCCEFGNHGIVVETIHRFKGLEADLVIVLLSTPTSEDRLDVALYVGMSRARALLFVVATPQVLGPLRRRLGNAL
jgi:hypothetical protein